MSETVLLEGLKKAVTNGERAEDNFKPQTYQAIMATLQEKSYNIDLMQVKSCWAQVSPFSLLLSATHPLCSSKGRILQSNAFVAFQDLAGMSQRSALLQAMTSGTGCCMKQCVIQILVFYSVY